MNKRDCPHGHQLGKCDTCDLIEAQASLARKDAALAFATKALEQAIRYAKDRRELIDGWDLEDKELWDREDTLSAAALKVCRKEIEK